MKTAEKPTFAVQTRDMTEGNPIRLILAFTVPALIGNIFQQVYTIVDTMGVGYSLGDSAIAAIGATSSLCSLLVNLSTGMNSGYGIVVSKYFGAHDTKGLRRSIAGMLMLNLASAAAVTSFSLLYLRPLLRYMNTPESVFQQAHTYIAILCGGMLSTVCYNMFSAILRALGNSRTPLRFLTISCLLNIALDLLLVVGCDLGVLGAAAATIIAQSVSAILCGASIFWNYRVILPEKEDWGQVRSLLFELLSTGFAMALMFCVVDLGSTIFQRTNNLLGETYITAHTTARRIIGIMDQPLATIATANSTFVGQNWGAKKIGRIRETLKKVIGLELLWSILACCAAWVFGGALVQLTTGTTDVETVRNAVLSLRLHLSFFPALAVLLCLRSAMQAMGRKTAPVISSCLELIMKVLSARLLIPRLGFLGTCVTEPVTWVVMMIFLAVAYRVQIGSICRSLNDSTNQLPKDIAELQPSQMELEKQK